MKSLSLNLARGLTLSLICCAPLSVLAYAGGFCGVDADCQVDGGAPEICVDHQCRIWADEQNIQTMEMFRSTVIAPACGLAGEVIQPCCSQQLPDADGLCQ